MLDSKSAEVTGRFSGWFWIQKLFQYPFADLFITCYCKENTFKALGNVPLIMNLTTILLLPILMLTGILGIVSVLAQKKDMFLTAFKFFKLKR